jgi:hypothetical protein
MVKRSTIFARVAACGSSGYSASSASRNEEAGFNPVASFNKPQS